MIARDEARRLVEAYKGDDCILWTRRLDSAGYGRVYVDGRSMTASRYICELVHGPPDSPFKEAAHACRNRSCINPRHLGWATPAENQMHRVRDGTSNRGEAHGNAKLTNEDVVRIRKLAAGGWTEAALAEKFDVNRVTIHYVVKRATWVHI